MSNPLFDRAQQSYGQGPSWLSQGQQAIPQQNDLRNMYHAYQMANDKQGFLQQLASQGAGVRQVIQGGNYEQTVRALCKQRGIDADQFMNEFAQQMR